METATVLDFYLIFRFTDTRLPNMVEDVLTLTFSSVYWLIMVAATTAIIASIL